MNIGASERAPNTFRDSLPSLKRSRRHATAGYSNYELVSARALPMRFDTAAVVTVALDHHYLTRIHASGHFILQDTSGEIRHNPERGRYREYKYVIFKLWETGTSQFDHISPATQVGAS